ncbi:MAG TPA: alpha/beta fold hydrolase [Luteimonas sp.]|nr:alpha/beta fold hydrolase [Luteimonas sp.]HRO25909.1 alpha/beta fold hydrolase [Luteimonas sp.]HRP71778.1 alpha/beta fold hydrolase [Luteimonas sp.]
MLLLLGACLLLAGFAWPGEGDALGRRLVAPGGVSPILPTARIDEAITRLPHREGRVTTSAGVSLFWRAFDPGAYRLDYAYRPDGSSRGRMDFRLDFASPGASSVTPRGTVLLLHGWMMDGGSLLPWSLQLAQAGYRTISLDLRNHGRSGAAPSGYGTREARDVADAVAVLRAQGEIIGPLHLMGVSYGAATAIFSARELGAQVDNVIALESFQNAGHAIRDMVPHMLHQAPETLAQQFSHRWLRWKLDDAALEHAIAAAGDALRLPLDSVDVGAALAQVPACVLLLHGREDGHVPVAHGRALAAAAPRAHYIEVPGEDHISLPMRLDLLAPTVIDWLDNASPKRFCPPPLALADAQQA